MSDDLRIGSVGPRRNDNNKCLTESDVQVKKPFKNQASIFFKEVFANITGGSIFNRVDTTQSTAAGVIE